MKLDKLYGINIYYSKHVCTVPDTCAYASKAFEDAKVFNFKGVTYGYSPSSRTLIVTKPILITELKKDFNKIITIAKNIK